MANETQDCIRWIWPKDPVDAPPDVLRWIRDIKREHDQLIQRLNVLVCPCCPETGDKSTLLAPDAGPGWTSVPVAQFCVRNTVTGAQGCRPLRYSPPNTVADGQLSANEVVVGGPYENGTACKAACNPDGPTPECAGVEITMDDTLPDGVVGEAYSGGVTASGGASPYTYLRTAGALPTGLTLATSGAITGTPTVAGVADFIVTATDANGCTGERAYSVLIDCPLDDSYRLFAYDSLHSQGTGIQYNAIVTRTSPTVYTAGDGATVSWNGTVWVAQFNAAEVGPMTGLSNPGFCSVASGGPYEGQYYSTTQPPGRNIQISVGDA